MERTDVGCESFWTRRYGWLSLLVIVVVAVLGYLLDRMMVREGVPGHDLLALSNAITGVIAGSFFFYLARHEKAHREFMRERVQVVAGLNHHIRNALQVIKFCESVPGHGPEASPLQMIKESAERIEWALREVLPQYPEQAAFPVPTGYAAVGSPIRPIGPFLDQLHETRLR